jgi:hypothetical protein
MTRAHSDPEATPAPVTAAAGADAQRAPGPRLRHGWFTTVCALLGLLTGALGLFWDFAPQYRPDPLDTVGADVAVVAVEPGVSVRRWLRAAYGEDSARAAGEIFGRGPSRAELGQVGEMIYVRTQVDGHKHKNISLAYWLYMRGTDTPVEVPLPPYLARVQRSRLVAPSQRSVQLLWMPDFRSPDESDVFIRMELRSDRGLLAVADSATLHRGKLVR